MPDILGKERFYLLYSTITQEDADFEWLAENAEPITWDIFFIHVPRDHFKMVDPFNLYYLTPNVNILNVYSDFQPMQVGSGYVAKIFILYQYGMMYLFTVEGEEAWYNKAIYDIKHGNTKKKLTLKLKGKLGAPFGERHGKTNLTEDIVMKIRYSSEFKKLTQEKIGKKFGISKYAVSRIKLRNRWSHL